MAANGIELPIIDLAPYVNPKQPGDREKVIAEVRDACGTYGFFQLKGHGIPIEHQKGLFQAMKAFFSQPKEEKLKASFLTHPCRRGYEASGDSLRDSDIVADAKECFYIGREDTTIAHGGFYGPNNWPQMPDDVFRRPVWAYYEDTAKLGRILWEILLQALGHPPEALKNLAARPLVGMKCISYPDASGNKPGQPGAGAHRDFGGVTILLQQPGKEGLEVWLEEQQQWLPVAATEDVYVINCGDMVERWSGGKIKSVLHRVINKAEGERMSCAMFWHGDVTATNPLNPSDPDKSTVGQLWMKRFKNQMHVPKATAEMFASA